MEELIRLRRELHRNPELSGSERATAKRIRFFLSRYKPHELYSGIAGEGMAAVYNGTEQGPTLLFRCDMDALPIQERSALPYSSSVPGVAHLCGHDGHMAMVSGLAVRLSQNPIKKGRVVLFYQPEEETGKGAEKAIGRLADLDLSPTYTFAIHNMPKYPAGSLVVGRNTFSAASKGLVVKLFGKESHAAYPESGLNPALAVSDIIRELLALPNINLFKEYVLVTLIYTRIGEVAFGTSAGYAEIMVTLRAFHNPDMELLSAKSIALVEASAAMHGLRVETQFTEAFPASVCDVELTSVLENIASEQNRKLISMEQPNRWSEDFAHFTIAFPSLIFGLGVGEEHPDLHTPNYDFPDTLIDSGVDVFEAIIRKYLG
ncbi:MAG: amidohydrolase [Bacteroidales bacterium]|nr:amidohydrolase [Bacteroidales bacterium]MBN2748940.1 amidohydrolase [Bacteroidales bacterium]